MRPVNRISLSCDRDSRTIHHGKKHRVNGKRNTIAPHLSFESNVSGGKTIILTSNDNVVNIDYFKCFVMITPVDGERGYYHRYEHGDRYGVAGGSGDGGGGGGGNGIRRRRRSWRVVNE